MDEQSDAELVDLARAGNRDAFGELILRHQRSVYGLACVLLGDRFEAEDITQEAFLRAWLNLDLLADPAKFAPWLRRIVFGVSIDWLRAFRPDLYRLARAGDEVELFARPAGAESALAGLETIELRQRVWNAVARLPSHYRLPLTMFHLDGLSHAKIAQAIGAPESTVRSLVTRARQRLEPMLASYAAEVLPALQDVLKGQERGKSDMLHITDGESVAGTLRESGVPGEVMIYGDLMYEGPVPAGLSAEEWWETRARFLAESGYSALDEARRYLAGFEETLAEAPRHEETVLWLDHRLSDQLILIKLLDWFGRRPPGSSRLSLICVGRYPGMDSFVGLGQLTADQLASLADTRQRVSQTQLDLGRMAWSAFASPDPAAIERVIEGDTSSLPFLAAALRRHLEQFPSLDNGLSRTERQILSVLREHGALPASRLFFAVQRMEDPLFMGDHSFRRILDGLAAPPHPLVEGTSPVTITETGLRVLEGRDDHVRLNGIDCWLGGVHLKGADAVWRWDRAGARLAGPRV